MKGIKNILLLLAALCSCDLGNDEDCCYNVRLEYQYQRYGTLGGNELGYYVTGLREYVFDGHDVLRAVNEYKVPHGGGDFFSEQTLAPGRYTVITLGNKNGNELINSEQVGVTAKQDLLLTLNALQESPAATYQDQSTATQGRSDRLYYGYRTFEVAEYGVSRIAVDMTHAHNVLGVTVRWVDNTGHPKSDENYVMTLRQVPAKYSLMPEFMVYSGLEGAEFSAEDEVFPFKDRRRINCIPTVSKTESVSHAVAGSVSGKTLNGQFVTFRYRTDSEVLLSIRSETEQVMKEIDLNRFFREVGISLDYSLCQEYSLWIEIDGDAVRVGLVSVDDWEDGGVL